MTRQVVLDTETTGMPVEDGHRVIEVGCVELVDGKQGFHFHTYINPGPGARMDEEALQVHGITLEFLKDKPSFAEIAEDLLVFIDGAELVAHNAEFDVGFLDNELAIAGRPETVASVCSEIHDTLGMARQAYPGAAASLDALCRRFQIDNTKRSDGHGALIDAELLLAVWQRLSAQQNAFDFSVQTPQTKSASGQGAMPMTSDTPILVRKASEEEQQAHLSYLKDLGDDCVWQRLE